MASSPLPWLGSQGEEGLGTIGAGRTLAGSLTATSSSSGSRSPLYFKFHTRIRWRASARLPCTSPLVLPSENLCSLGVACGRESGVQGEAGRQRQDGHSWTGCPAHPVRGPEPRAAWR